MRPRTAPTVALGALLLCVACSGTSSPAPVTTTASSVPSPEAATTSARPPAAATQPAPPSVVVAPTGTFAPGASASATAAPSEQDTAPTETAAAWPVYHRDALRSGLDSAFPVPASNLQVAWRRSLDGAVYGQPLVVDGRVIAATENDSVYAIDPATGRVEWRTHLGTPVPLRSLPCGNIDPLGITGTPAFDPASGSLFVVAEVSGPRHVLFALDPASGAVRWSRDVDLAGHEPRVHQQRTALAVGNGYVYFGYGGLAGDCGAYRGAVVGVPVSGRGDTIAYEVPVRREGGIWATGGPVLDPRGDVYVSVGNGSSTSSYDGSDSVLELSATLRLRSRFAPTTWADDNAADLDLGSLSPVLLPGGWVFIAGKRGVGYTLRQGDLGGIGGQVASARVCAAFGAAAVQGSTVYLPCQDGIREVRIEANGSIRVGWSTASGANGPPVIGGDRVWAIDTGTGVLFALDPATGAARGQVALGGVPHFASPTLWDGSVLVGTLDGVVAVRSAG